MSKMDKNLSPEGMQKRIIDDILKNHDELYCITNGLDGRVFIAIVAPYLQLINEKYDKIKRHKSIGLVDASYTYWDSLLKQNMIDSEDNYRC